MREYKVYEEIKCDLCGSTMGSERGASLRSVTLSNVTLSNETIVQVQGVVKVSAFYYGREVTCICDRCRKAILQDELQRLEQWQ